jgi:hypothetical protein
VSGFRRTADKRARVIAGLQLASWLLLRDPTLVRRKEIVVQGKQMFKVISPIEKRNGEKYWVRCGTGFTNKDDSINMYIDVLPVAADKSLTLQLRVMTDEDLRPNADKRAQFNLPRTSSGMSNLDSMQAAASHDSVPF